ncbi:MAG: MerR family transcriptional regulator [Lewinellaceae bacterium]|nr:MerR family transcriptional regulator [Lewinellaceae bacterium]
MIPPDEELVKRYYSISEVATMFDVSTSLIRFWENEFEVLKPHKNAKGDRRFTPENIGQMRQIYHLVKERGFTLQGAKQEIRHLQESSKKKGEILQRLRDLRNDLQQLKDQL